MKYRIRLYRGDVFASVIIYFPPCDITGFTFTHIGKTFKIIECVFDSFDEYATTNIEGPLLTVVEIPTI